MTENYTFIKPIKDYLPRSFWTPWWVALLIFLFSLGVFYAAGPKLGELTSPVYFSRAMLCGHALTLTLLAFVLWDVRQASAHLSELDSIWVGETIQMAQLIANPRYQTEAFERGLEQLLEWSTLRWVLPIVFAVPITLIGLYAHINHVRLYDSTPAPWLLFIGGVEFLSVVLATVFASLWFRMALFNQTNAVKQEIQDLYNNEDLDRLAVQEAVTAKEIVTEDLVLREEALKEFNQQKKDDYFGGIDSHDFFSGEDTDDLFGGSDMDDPFGGGSTDDSFSDSDGDLNPFG